MIPVFNFLLKSLKPEGSQPAAQRNIQKQEKDISNMTKQASTKWRGERNVARASTLSSKPLYFEQPCRNGNLRNGNHQLRSLLPETSFLKQPTKKRSITQSWIYELECGNSQESKLFIHFSFSHWPLLCSAEPVVVSLHTKTPVP